MAYSDFTLDSLRSWFGLNIAFTTQFFAEVSSVSAPAELTLTVQKNRALAAGNGTKKARAAYLTAPVVGQIYHETNHQCVVLPGVKFNVSRKQGLTGFCDYLIVRSLMFMMVDAPVVAIVEAEKEDLNPATAQCIASMVAVQLFNEQKKQPTSVVYGCVTSGSGWRFLRLHEKEATVDLTEYGLSELDKILGILLYMARGDESKAAA